MTGWQKNPHKGREGAERKLQKFLHETTYVGNFTNRLAQTGTGSSNNLVFTIQKSEIKTTNG
jgi:hypothetical protein